MGRTRKKPKKNPTAGEHVTELGDYMRQAHGELDQAAALLKADKPWEAASHATTAQTLSLWALLQVQYLRPHVGQKVVDPQTGIEYAFGVEQLERAEREAREVNFRGDRIRLEALCLKRREPPTQPPKNSKNKGPHLKLVTANPVGLLPGSPRYIVGKGGRGSVWNYRGREVDVVAVPTTGQYKACWHDKGMSRCSWGNDEHGALANARFEIEVEDLGNDWWEAQHAIHTALDHLVDETKEPINRGRLARHLEVLYRVPAPSYRISPRHMDAFYRLSLDDRLRLLDAVLDYQERSGFFDPARRVANPDPEGTRAELLMA